MFFPKYVSKQSAWSAVVLRTLKYIWMDGGGANGMVIPSTTIAARITCRAVGGRRPQSRVSLYKSCFAANTGQRTFCILQMSCAFTEDSHESRVILWGVLVESCVLFQIAFRPLLEPAGHALVFSQRERCRQNLQYFESDRLKEREDVVAVVCKYNRRVMRCCIFF